MKVYKFGGLTYQSEQAVRMVLWRKKNLILPSRMDETAWANIGVQIEDIAIVYTETQLARQARAKRDRLLSASDYYVMPDYPATTQGLIEVKAYRQALRDISKQDGFPTNVTWPAVPVALG